MRRQTALNLTAGEVRCLEILTSLAITQWPAHLIDVDDNLISLQHKADQARQELER